MADENASPAELPNADDRIAELENKLADVNRRYAASSEEGKRLAQLNQQLQYQAMPRQTVPNRKPWEESLETSGVPVDAIRAAIEEQANDIVQRQFEPLTRALSARQTMVGKYKDYNKFESDMMGHINSDPELQQTYTRIFNADPVAAFDWAYLKFGQEARGKRGRGGSQAGMDEEISETRIPTNRSGDARRIPMGNEGAVQDAARAYRDHPSAQNAQAYARARLKTAISDDFLNQA